MGETSERTLKCPGCGTILAVPPGACNKVVRCRSCRCQFRVVVLPAVTDNDVLHWLDEDEPAEATEQVAAAMAGSGGGVVTQTVAHKSARKTIPIRKGRIRVVRLEHNSVTLEFAARRLADPAFRCALPRRCIQCGTHVYLQAHVIIYSSHLTDSISLEAEHSAGALALSEQQVRDLDDEKLLAMLPKVPNVPPPGNLPMPYWLCRMCHGQGAVSGQIQVNTSTGQGRCRLRLANLEIAAAFLAAVGGQDNPGYQAIREQLEAAAENPWDLLPTVVQNRLQQWYKPRPEEQFLAYVPSRDHAYTEDGMEGLVISSRRLIYHTACRHKEVEAPASVELQTASGDGKTILRMKTPAWELKRFALDGDGMKRLRRGIARSGFTGVWH